MGISMKKHFHLIIVVFLALGCASGNKGKSEKQKKADLYFSHGTSNLQDKKYTEALSNLMKAATYTPDDSRIQNNLGMAFYFKKDKNQAIHHIKKAIELDEKNYDAYVNLASIYYNDNNFRAAEKYYQKVRKALTYKAQYRVLYNLSLIEFKRGNSIKTLEYLEQAITENSEYCPAYYLRGRVLETQRKFKEAYDAYRKSYHGSCYNSPAPHYKAAVMLAKEGEFLQARLKFNEVMERFPTSVLAAKSRTYLERISGKVKEKEMSNNKLKKIEEEVRKYQSADF